MADALEIAALQRAQPAPVRERALLPAPVPVDEDQVATIPLGERWIVDGLAVIPGPGGMALLLCDMTVATRALMRLRERGRRATYTHVVVRAAALALKRNPELHQTLCDYRMIRPGHVDIGLSVAGQTTYAPVMVIPAAERMPLYELVSFVNAGVKATLEKEQKDLAGIRRSGWIIPFGALRRFILRRLHGSFWFRRKLAGTLQISCLPGTDVVVPFLFYSGCVLGAGKVVDRVVVADGAPAVRRTMWLSIAIDHRSMDGRRASDLLNAIREILEGDELLTEAEEGPVS